MLIPAWENRMPPESVEQFATRLYMQWRKATSTKKRWSWETWNFENEIVWEEFGDFWERTASTHRLAGESNGEFIERFYSEGAAINDEDDTLFLRRVAWTAEIFNDPSLATATAKLDLSLEEADRLNRPRKLRMPYAGSLRNALRFSFDKQEIVVDHEALRRWLRHDIGWKFWDYWEFEEIYRSLLLAVEGEHAVEERIKQASYQPKHPH